MLTVRVIFLLLGTTLLFGCQQEPAAERAEHLQQPSSADSIPPSRARKVPLANNYTSLLTTVLQRVVNPDGLVHYDRLRAEQGDAFNRVLRTIERTDADTLDTHNEKMAFWLNAYNVLMLKNVLDHPSVVNIQKDGFAKTFFRTPLRVAEHGLTLDQIENAILRRQPDSAVAPSLRVDSLDPRLHAAVNCAARGCPRLRRHAFTAQQIDKKLHQAMHEFVNNPKHFRVKKNGQILMSSIVNWFGPDFERPGKSAGDYLRSFLDPDRPHYKQLNTFLKGRSARALHNADRVQFQYNWLVNRTGI